MSGSEGTIQFGFEVIQRHDQAKFSGLTVRKCQPKVTAVKNPFGPFNVIRNRDPMIWSRAESYCRSLGGNIPLPKSQEENDWLALLGDTQLAINSFTGLSNRDRHYGGLTKPVTADKTTVFKT